MKNPVIFWLLVFFTLLNVADAITANYILAGEANPLYIEFGSLLPVYILKFVVVSIFWFVYNRNIFNNHYLYYLYVMFLVLGTVGVSLGVASNTYGILNEDVLEESSKISAEEKVQAYNLFTLFIIYIPSFLSFITFVFYQTSLKRAKIGKHHWKGIPWYKRF